jgi:N6-L-threonylcarbamoyladenine synthase
MLRSGDLNFSFSGLKTAALTLINQQEMTNQVRAAIAHAFQDAVVEVLTEKCMTALVQTGLDQLVVAGGVGANRRLRQVLCQKAEIAGVGIFFPELEFCTDNGAMIAFAGAMQLQAGTTGNHSGRTFAIKARWELETQAHA